MRKIINLKPLNKWNVNGARQSTKLTGIFFVAYVFCIVCDFDQLNQLQKAFRQKCKQKTLLKGVLFSICELVQILYTYPKKPELNLH